MLPSSFTTPHSFKSGRPATPAGRWRPCRNWTWPLASNKLQVSTGHVDVMITRLMQIRRQLSENVTGLTSTAGVLICK